MHSVTFNHSENWLGAGSKSGGVKIFDLDENKGAYTCTVSEDVHVCATVLRKLLLCTCTYIHVHIHIHHSVLSNVLQAVQVCSAGCLGI